MQDRVPTHPGRVTLTPVSGQANTYDMVRADSPTQEGTPLNKNNLLKDSTAALYGLGSDAVPDEVLAKAKELIAANSTAIANGVKIATGSYVGTGTYGSSNPCSLTFDFVPVLILIKGITEPSSTTAKTRKLGWLFPTSYTTEYTNNSWEFEFGSTSMAYAYAKVSSDKKTVYFYHANSAYAQDNHEDCTYCFAAFG